MYTGYECFDLQKNDINEAARLIGVKLKPAEPISAGIILSYKCNCECRHCMYSCSPRWNPDWIDVDDLWRVLKFLAPRIRRHAQSNVIGVNKGLHFTGGEPFLNYSLLLRSVEMAAELDIPATFVETNCFWCIKDEVTERRMRELKAAGLHGMLISSNPFVTECIPFERIKRAVRIAERVFEGNVIVYHPYFHAQLNTMKRDGKITFEEYLSHMEGDPLGLRMTLSEALLPMGRAAFRLGRLYRRHPAKAFFGERCVEELTRPWHVHIDNYMNYMTGYCAGISLGDARKLDEIMAGIDLDDLPVLGALTSDLKELYELGRSYGYRERGDGYISKCHLCLDIRKHLVNCGEFKELKPKKFYELI